VQLREAAAELEKARCIAKHLPELRARLTELERERVSLAAPSRLELAALLRARSS
jgi:hypothetical protein